MEIMFDKIVVGYDGSKQSEKAFEIALEIATRFGAGLLAVSVVRLPVAPAEGELTAIIDDGTERIEEDFAKLRRNAWARRVVLKTEIAVGHPGEQLCPVPDSGRSPMSPVVAFGACFFDGPLGRLI